MYLTLFFFVDFGYYYINVEEEQSDASTRVGSQAITSERHLGQSQFGRRDEWRESVPKPRGKKPVGHLIFDLEMERTVRRITRNTNKRRKQALQQWTTKMANRNEATPTP